MFVVIAHAEFCHKNQQISTKDASILAVEEGRKGGSFRLTTQGRSWGTSGGRRVREGEMKKEKDRLL